MRVAIIGCGPSGLAAIKSCREEGLDPVCFEAEEDLGGLWRFTEEEDSHSSVYRSVVINTSKEMMSYSDFPIDTDQPTFLHHTGVVRYLASYARHFGLLDFVQFGARVESVRPADGQPAAGDCQWDVTIAGRAPQRFDKVMVCTGHHSIPSVPEFPGADCFEGRQLHTHAYKDHVGFEGRNVVVVGVGNSGCDISVELSRHAAQVYQSTRSGTYVLHRYTLGGRPLDHHTSRFVHNCVPNWLMAKGFGVLHALTNGDVARFGLEPKHGILQAHPTISSELIGRIGVGAIKVKPNVKRIHERSVQFEDGSEVEADDIIYATGYRIAFPFLGADVVAAENNDVRLFEYIWKPGLRSLAFIGLFQPLGAIMPMSEAGTRWVARVWAGRCALPDEPAQHRGIARRVAINRARYKPSPRHTIQVDYPEYMETLGRYVGCKPSMWRVLRTNPRLWFYLMFGPLVPQQYRLQGPHKWDGAADAIIEVLDNVYKPTWSRRVSREPATHFESVVGGLRMMGFLLVGFLLLVGVVGVSVYRLAV